MTLTSARNWRQAPQGPMKSPAMLLVTTMERNDLYPSDTAFTMAVLSAQRPTVYAAFSTLHPLGSKLFN